MEEYDIEQKMNPQVLPSASVVLIAVAIAAAVGLVFYLKSNTATIDISSPPVEITETRTTDIESDSPLSVEDRLDQLEGLNEKQNPYNLTEEERRQQFTNVMKQ